MLVKGATGVMARMSNHIPEKNMNMCAINIDFAVKFKQQMI